jgi:hypothetical protein
MDENHIMTMWDLFREYIPEKNREMAANQYVDFLANEFDIDVLEGFMGYDPHLDDAIKTLIDENSGWEDEEEEDYNDEEDY